MTTWQADFYRRPVQDEAGNPLWELVVCDAGQFSQASNFPFAEFAWCPQSQANATWLTHQLQQWISTTKTPPTRLQVFRPQALSLLETAAQPLGIVVEPTRHTTALKQLLQERADHYRTLPHYTGQPYEPVKLEQPPPLPLPEQLWGEQWRFAAIAAGDLELAFADKPIPIRSMPTDLLPMSLQLASNLPIPGVVIDGGRQSMRLARWLQEVNPVALQYIPGAPDGLILEAGLVDRWVIATFEDKEAIAAAQTFRQRQEATQGMHFLLVQPDNSGMTYSGLWLLRNTA
ncbi:Tab2/Atab2 family RNA-binding protein [Oscillatoria sp. FACHB-1407]|uniref:Tab2/Atab2 family RNA-binding protein n=1 Tax=Oscillatoria sp. FACHB-1407 TaxID=2692847 RepID=UPI0016843E93|nr:Tab2/Atab2 family RNA-binding protein [Oscillatoria sp. FACHB-1407]MBD2460155.1 Tab2/Atab2 family RNA-binding protein [Oscillatoria sp. FACHB-1407]